MNNKTILRLAPHEMLPGHFVIEAWHEGRLVCTVAGRDGPGVRVITKHALNVHDVVRNPLLNIVEIEVKP
jgi:hypothetical protein